MARELDPCRIFGFLLGLMILGSVFLLPFSYRGARPLTLYEVARTTAEFWREISRLTEPVVALNTAFLMVFILLVFAGLTGFFALGSGVIGVFAMVVMSSVLFLFWPQIVLGSGYYVSWATSLAILGIGIWRKRARDWCPLPVLTKRV